MSWSLQLLEVFQTLWKRFCWHPVHISTIVLVNSWYTVDYTFKLNKTDSDCYVIILWIKHQLWCQLQTFSKQILCLWSRISKEKINNNSITGSSFITDWFMHFFIEGNKLGNNFWCWMFLTYMLKCINYNYFLFLIIYRDVKINNLINIFWFTKHHCITLLLRQSCKKQNID